MVEYIETNIGRYNMEIKLNPHLVAKTNGKCNPKQEYITGKIRITVIAPELIRVEFDDRSTFVDSATQSIWFRDLGECPFTLRFLEKHIEVKTEKAVYYINRKKKRIDYVSLNGEIIKANNSDNLKGTYRTLDMTRGRAPLGIGVIGKKGVAVIEDNSLILGEDGECKPRPSEKDVYCFATKNPQRALSLFYKITGAPPMVPRYALGNWWSRYRRYSQSEYLELMDKFIEKEIPFTVATIDMDWHWVDVAKRFGYKTFRDSYICQRGWTGYSWNTELFPDYKEFLRELKAKNLHVTVNLHPASGVRSFENQYEEMCKEMGVPADGSPIRFDCTNPKFLNAYFKVLHKPYEKDGVDFWWIDWQQGKKSKLPGLDPLWACNHYHTLDNGANGKRPLILSRYAGLGSHRYPLGFSGDACIVWKSLDFQPYFTYTASNVGYTHWSHDIGGHTMGNPENDELYLRWVQFGIFTPIMRLHSSNMVMSKEPWNHKTVEEEATQALRFRHTLIPYLYTAYYDNFANYVPVCKPLYYDYPGIKEAYQAKNQYMFGPNLMVCPITTKWNKEGVSTREIWLPDGIWTDIFTGEVLGGGVHTISRDKKSIPVFAKQGAIIPYADVEGNDFANPESMVINVYNCADGAYTLYEDDGETTDYINGKGAFTKMKLKNNLFTIYPTEGEISLVPQNRTYTVCFEYDIENSEVLINGEKTEAQVYENTVIISGVKPSDKVEIRINL